MEMPRVCIGAWVCVAFALLAPAAARLNVDEMQAMQTTSNEVKVSEQPLTSTKKPELAHNSTHLKLGKCFHMPRSACPERGQDCRVIDGVSVFCCDVGNTWLREGLHTYLTQTTVHLHVSNAHIAELNVSAAVFRRLTSMAFTDGSIGKIVGQFPKHSSIACLNISNNNLTTAKLEPSSQRPFAYLFNLTVLDASANNLTEFPLSLVQSNRKISVDFSGNNYLPCKHFQKAMEVAGNSNSTLVTFINYENTKCALGVQYDWFKDVQFVNIDHLKEQKALNDSCRKIRPPDINCTCATRRLEIFGNEVTNLVAVDCSQRRLKEMPTNLPANTVELNVSYNNITSLTAVGDDPTYESLRQLIVHHNDIDKIIPLEGTKFIDNFMLFSISHNKLRTIPTYLLSNKFDANGNYITLFVGGNDIVCDCNQVKIIKEWLLEHLRNIPDYKELMCQDGLGSVADLDETVVCHTARDWTDYIYYIIALEVLILVLLITKVSYDYWVFKTAGYLPWPANKMPRLPCDWLCE